MAISPAPRRASSISSRASSVSTKVAVEDSNGVYGIGSRISCTSGGYVYASISSLYGCSYLAKSALSFTLSRDALHAAVTVYLHAAEALLQRHHRVWLRRQDRPE